MRGSIRARDVLLEGLLVAAAGCILAFAANALSPRGLALTRNYYPAAVTNPVLPATNPSTPGIAQTNPASPLELLAARLAAKGLHLADSNRVVQLFQDPRHQQDLVVFVDARNDEHYQEGHIPGAYQLDYYHFEKYLPALLPICSNADVIVVYCTGGDCEDSELTAGLLGDANIAREKLLVFAGGFTEWSANGLPIETGQRGSGTLLHPTNRPGP